MNNKALSNNSSNNHSSNAAADPQTVLTADQVVEQLRALRAAIPEVAALTAKERQLVRSNARSSAEVVQAQIDFIGASALIETAVGHDLDEARQMVVDDDRWMTVERELKALLADVSGGNLRRRQKLHAVASQAYAVGSSLARTPLHPELKSRVAEVRRIKRASSRKSSSPEAPQPPASAQLNIGM